MAFDHECDSRLREVRSLSLVPSARRRTVDPGKDRSKTADRMCSSSMGSDICFECMSPRLTRSSARRVQAPSTAPLPIVRPRRR
jgi:hypothetical protein